MSKETEADLWFGIPQRVEKPSGGLPGNTWTFYDPTKVPASPSALDDEFSSSTLDPKWTTVNWGLPTTVDINTTVPDALYMRLPFNSNTLTCLLQSIPAGDYTIAIKASSQATQTSVSGGPLLVLSTTNTAGTGTQAVINWGISTNTSYVETFGWTNFNTAGGVIMSGITYCRPVYYMKLTRSGTNYGFYWSEDGKTWSGNFISLGALGFTPLYFGLGGFSGASGSLDMSVEFFRYFTSATALLGGTRTVYTT